MRDLLLGILLGIWLTTVQTWLERRHMNSASDAVFYLVSLGILALLAWRPIILPIIAKVRPELWLKLSDWNRAVDYEKTKAVVAERKAKREAKRGSKENGSSDSKRADSHQV